MNRDISSESFEPARDRASEMPRQQQDASGESTFSGTAEAAIRALLASSVPGIATGEVVTPPKTVSFAQGTLTRFPSFFSLG